MAKFDIKRSWTSILATCLGCVAFSLGQDTARSTPPQPTLGKSQQSSALEKRDNAPSPIQILSDTRGMDIWSYVFRVRDDIRENWYKVVPEVARPPLSKRGRVVIEFHLMKNGTVSDVKLKESSGDVSMDRAAFFGINTSSPFPALPSDFGCKYVALRFNFYYNSKPETPQNKTTPLIPCVTTTITPAQSE